MQAMPAATAVDDVGPVHRFRSHNFPDRYIRHRDFKLMLEGDDTPVFRGDATFHRIGG